MSSRGRLSGQVGNPGARLAKDMRDILIPLAYTSGDFSPEKAAKDLEIFSHIFQTSANPGTTPEERSASYQKLKDNIDYGRKIDPGAFEGLAKTFYQGDPDWEERAKAEGKDITKLLGLFGPAVGSVSRGAGFALSALGAYSDEVFSFLGQPGLNLSRSILPPTDIEVFAQINQVVYKKALDLSKNDPFLQAATSNPDFSSRMSVNLAPSDDDLLQRFSADLRDLIADTSVDRNNMQGDVSKTKEAVDLLALKVKEKLDDLALQSSEIHQMLSEQQRVLSVQQEAQLRSTEADRLQKEISGGVQIVGFFIGTILKDPVDAQKFTKAASTIQGLYTTVSSLLKVGLTFASVGSIVGAAGALFSILSGGQDESVVLDLKILDAVQHLQDQVEGLRKDMEQRFDRLEDGQRLILEGLAKVLSEVMESGKMESDKLDNISNDLAKQKSTTMAQTRQTAIDGLRTKARACKDFLTNNDRQPEFDFPGSLSEIASFAAITTTQIAFTGDVTDLSDLPQEAFAKVAKDVWDRKQTEQLFGWLPWMMDKVGLSHKALSLPNPVEWVTACQAYLEIKVLSPNIIVPASKNHLMEMIQTGREIREVMDAITSRRTLKQAASNYLDALTNVDPVKGSLFTILDDIYNKFAQKPFPDGTLLSSNFDTLVRPTPPNANFFGLSTTSDKLHTCTPEPFVIGLQNAILVLVSAMPDGYKSSGPAKPGIFFVVKHHADGQQSVLPYQYWGPDLDQIKQGIIWPSSVVALERSAALQFTIWMAGMRRGPPPDWPDIVGEFNDICQDAINVEHNFPLIKKYFPQFLSDNLSSDSSIANFEGWGAIFRVFSTLNLWRRSKAFAADDASNILNVSCPSRREDLQNILSDYLNKTESRSSRTVAEDLKQVLYSRIVDAVAKLLYQASNYDERSSLAEVDGMLRRLQGYMATYYPDYKIATAPSTPAEDRSAIPLRDEVVSWWNGEKNANDAVGSNHGAIVGNVNEYAPGYIGQAFYFSDDSTYVKVPHNDNLEPSWSFSVAAWLKAKKVTAPAGVDYFVIFDKSGVKPSTGWTLTGSIETGELFFSVNSYLAGDIAISSRVPIAYGRWQHVVCVYGGPRLWFYVDGELKSSSETPLLALAVGKGDLYFGHSREGSTSPAASYKGLIDEVGIYDIALTDQDVKRVFEFRGTRA